MYNISSLYPRVRKDGEGMGTVVAHTDSLDRETVLPMKGEKWCPVCNHTRTLDHFTPLGVDVPYYHPLCNQCAPLSPHRHTGWLHPLIRTVGTLLRARAVGTKSVFHKKQTIYHGNSADGSIEWSVSCVTGEVKVVLPDGNALHMPSSDALRLLVCLQSCEEACKQ